MRALPAVMALFALALPTTYGLHADPLPTRIGHCSLTAISRIGERLEDASTGRPVPGSGSSVQFANGGYQVSYEEVPQIRRARRGDRVRICLVSVPRNCPPGDTRGRIYKTFDLRTREAWTLPDSEHFCGGA
ncbi:MAG TPA: hypothetical protein VJ770_07295 [Stellaceae bacterium]|nr:hypothetical protein [Stellaceae bacterium]